MYELPAPTIPLPSHLTVKLPVTFNSQVSLRMTWFSVIWTKFSTNVRLFYMLYIGW